MISFGTYPSGTWSFIIKHNGTKPMVRPTVVVELYSDWLNCFTRTRYRSPRLGNRKAQSTATAFYPNLGDRDWERSR